MLKPVLAFFIFSLNSTGDDTTNYHYAGEIYINEVNFTELLEIPFIDEEDAFLIILERNKKPFKDTEDFRRRVPIEQYKLDYILPALKFKREKKFHGKFIITWYDSLPVIYSRISYKDYSTRLYYRENNLNFYAGTEYLKIGIFDIDYSWRSKRLRKTLKGTSPSLYFNYKLLESGISPGNYIFKLKAPFRKPDIYLTFKTDSSNNRYYALQAFYKIRKLYLRSSLEYDSILHEKLNLRTPGKEHYLSFTVVRDAYDTEGTLKFGTVVYPSIYFFFEEKISSSSSVSFSLRINTDDSWKLILGSEIRENSTKLTTIRFEMRNDFLAFNYLRDFEKEGNISVLSLNFDKVQLFYAISWNLSGRFSIPFYSPVYPGEYLEVDESKTGLLVSYRLWRLRLIGGASTSDFKIWSLRFRLEGEL